MHQDTPQPEPEQEPVRREALRRRAAIEAHRDRLLRSGLFDPDWYRARTPGAAGSDLDPLEHYLTHGVAALSPPGPLFDPADYLARAWHLERGVDDPLAHFLLHGPAEDRQARSVRLAGREDAAGRRSRPWRLLARSPERTLDLAVMVHAFHADLFGEICEALAFLPGRFTLLVSTDEEGKAQRIRALVAASGLDVFLLVRVCANRGRNFGPMLCRFRDAIRAHALLLHLHTKKSLHRGEEQSGWRRTTLRTLLPAAAAVNGLLHWFERDPSLGVLCPSPGGAVRYWAYTWLSNRALAPALFGRLGIGGAPPAGMFDFPLGGMFWARTAAIAPLLDHPWREQDFPEEAGQTDGTVMHAIERSIVLVARDRGYRFAELDYARGLLRPDWSGRNLDQYRDASHDGLLHTIEAVDTVSFDLFDTLLTRRALSPDAVHRFIGAVAERRFPGASGYAVLRQAAERAARRDRGGDGEVDLDEIHARFAADAGAGWSEAAVAFVFEQELALDARALVPRRVMVEALRAARARGRRTILCSDSYLARRQLDALLRQHGLADLLDEVYLSSERRARKDRGDLWRLLRRAESPLLLHVGDNEQSDIQQTADHGIRHFHVLSPAALFRLRGLAPDGGEGVLGDDVLLGPVAERLFNSPYHDACGAAPIPLSTPEDAGFVLLGPLLFAFVAWLRSHPAVRHLERLFFVSREGWFLRRLFDAVAAEVGDGGLPPPVYFQCSRRAALGALQGLGLDVEPVLRGAGFRGSVSEFLVARLGFEPDPSFGHARQPVTLPRDAALLRCVMELLRAPIEAHGRPALRDLRAYAASVGMEAGGRYGFVDVGYSGTMQTALQDLLGCRLVGLYMGVSHAASQVLRGGGHAFGAFADGDVAGFTGGYGLMLEAFLTAPHGQVVGYDAGVSPPVPLLRRPGRSQSVFGTLERFYAGAEEYALGLLRCWGPEVLSLPFRPEAATAMLAAVRSDRLRLDPALARTLSVEDDFCGSGEIALFPGDAGDGGDAGA